MVEDNKQERSRRGCIYPYVIYLIGVSYCLLRNQGKSRSLYVVTFNQLALICITMEYLENKRQYICQTIISFFLLGLGGSIYLLFRPKTLLMFKWVDSLGLSEYLDRLRDMVSDITLNHITLYSLPDGLWLASYIIVVNTIVSKNNKYNLRIS